MSPVSIFSEFIFYFVFFLEFFLLIKHKCTTLALIFLFFFGQMGQFLDGQIQIIEVTDIEPDVFHQLLVYVYTGRIDKKEALGHIPLLDLLAAADKYRLLELKVYRFIGKIIMYFFYFCFIFYN